MKEVYINKNDANQRLDKFITKYMPKLPQSMLYKGLRKNCVRINGKHVKDSSVFLKEGDVLCLYFNSLRFNYTTINYLINMYLQYNIVYFICNT